MARAIDAEKYMEFLKEQYLHHKSIGNSQAAKAWQGAMQLLYDMPTLTPPNEPMLERVVREYLEICGEDCAGDPSVGIPECPFYQYADVMDNGALISTRCELAAYCRPPEGEEDT